MGPPDSTMLGDMGMLPICLATSFTISVGLQINIVNFVAISSVCKIEHTVFNERIETKV